MVNIKELNLHDWKLDNISIDYSSKKIVVNISYENSLNKENKIMVLNNAKFLEVSFNEPWGRGIYIYECRFEKKEDNSTQINMILNSGDNINIRTSEIEICNMEK